jgi:hypothetical protein
MQFRWPFPIRPQSHPTDEANLRVARAELSSAEGELDQARAAYLRLQNSRQTAKLRLQQSVLDQALLRYHAARQAVRSLERPEIGAMPWLGLPRRRGAANDGVTKG